MNISNIPPDKTQMKRIVPISDQCYAWMVLIVALLMTLAFGLYPMVADDLAFPGFWKQHDGGNFTFEGWLGFVKYIRATDNSRLCNLLAPVWMVCLPEWLTAIAAGAIAACTMLIMAKMIAPQKNRVVFALVFLASILLLPWRDNLMSNDYCLNYVYAALLSLIVIKNLSMQAELPTSAAGRVLLFFVCFLLGAWTEVFAVPVLCGLGVLAMLRKFRMPAIWWGCFFSIIIGLLIFGISHGSVNRGENQLFVLSDEYKWRLVARQPSVVVLVIYCFIALFVHKWRQNLRSHLSSPTIVVIFVSMLAGLAMTCALETGSRASYWPILASIAIWGRILWPRMQTFFSPQWQKWLAIVIFACGCALVAIQYPAEKAFRKQSNEVMAALQSNKEREEVKLKNFEAIPRWKALFIPREMWTSQLQRGCMEEYEPSKIVKCEGDLMIITKIHN